MDYEYSTCNKNNKKEQSMWGHVNSLTSVKSVFEEQDILTKLNNNFNASILNTQSPLPIQSTVMKANQPTTTTTTFIKPQKDVFHFGQTEKHSLPRPTANAIDNTKQGCKLKSIKSKVSLDSKPLVLSNKKRKHTPSLHFSLHPKTPFILTQYISLGLSIFLALLTIYIITSVILTIHHDVNIKIELESVKIQKQAGLCGMRYRENACGQINLVPALVGMCGDWERCMHRDPREVGKFGAGAEAVAEILNKLVDPLSTKSLIFGIFGLIGIGALIVNGWVGKPTLTRKVNQRIANCVDGNGDGMFVGNRDEYINDGCLTDRAFKEYNRMNGMYTNDGLVLRK